MIVGGSAEVMLARHQRKQEQDESWERWGHENIHLQDKSLYFNNL